MSGERNTSEMWEVKGATAAYFKFLEENVDTVKQILGVSEEGITPEVLLAATEQTEEQDTRTIALVALVTKAMLAGYGLNHDGGAEEIDEFTEPTDNEVFPDPWSIDARVEMQEMQARVNQGYEG